MRIGLDLRGMTFESALGLGAEADRLGLWAVLVDGTDALVLAASLAATTEQIHLAVVVDVDTEHPFTLGEEIVVLDHLSSRRVLVATSGSSDRVALLRRLLGGEVVDGAALTPPPAQSVVPLWAQAELRVRILSGDLAADRSSIDAERDAGTTHLFITWPGPLEVAARHLATRAAVADFPQLVADLADRLGA